MKEKRILRTFLATALSASFASSAFSEVTVTEAEANDPIQKAQQLNTIDASGCVAINGFLGDPSTPHLKGPWTADRDFYSFRVPGGDTISVDIDNGIKGFSEDSVDTNVAIFGPELLMEDRNDDKSPKDDGSNSTLDARIDSFTVPVGRGGIWTVGVSGMNRLLAHEGLFDTTEGSLKPLNARSNGPYILRICGLKPAVKPIKIEVKPGIRKFDVVQATARDAGTVVNPNAKGVIPVALLGSGEFNPFAINVQSLKFGKNGDEASLHRCHNEPQDVNKDGHPDRLCHFHNELAGFDIYDDRALLTGNMSTGEPFGGNGLLKVVPAKHPE